MDSQRLCPPLRSPIAAPHPDVCGSSHMFGRHSPTPLYPCIVPFRASMCFSVAFQIHPFLTSKYCRLPPLTTSSPSPLSSALEHYVSGDRHFPFTLMHKSLCLSSQERDSRSSFSSDLSFIIPRAVQPNSIRQDPASSGVITRLLQQTPVHTRFHLCIISVSSSDLTGTLPPDVQIHLIVLLSSLL